MSQKNAGAILIVATHGIGDLIMMMPTLLRIGELGNKLKILVKDSACEDVAKYFLGDAVECLPLASIKKSTFMRFLKVVSWIRKNKCSVSLSQFGVSVPLYSLLSLLGGVKSRYGWSGRFCFLNTASLIPEGRHKVEENARLLGFLSINYSKSDLFLSKEIDNSIRGHFVVLGPGSGIVESHKRWPVKKYAYLACRLADHIGCEVFVVGGPEEQSLCEELVELSGSSKVVSLAGKMTIQQTLDFLAKSKVVVSNCNGISHMASAVGCHVVGLYGPTNFSLTGPYSRLAVKVSANLHCAPCYRRGYITGCGAPVCMDAVSENVVFDKVSELLEGCDVPLP